MSLYTKLQVSLNGTIFNKIIQFSLEEQLGDHAEFKVTLRGDVLERSLNGTSLLESSRSFLGKPFSLEISDTGRYGHKSLYFKGQVTGITGKKGNENGGLGDVINVTGKSNSVLLDDGVHMSSALNAPLSDILHEALMRYPNANKLVAIKPEKNTVLAYSVQHHQSTFKYLQYLAATQGEYLLYNRDTLYFGKPNLGDAIVLKYGVDLKDFSLGLSTEPLNFNYYSNDYKSESSVQSSSKNLSHNKGGYTAFASSVSNRMYPKPDNKQVYYGFESNQLQKQLDEAVALQKQLAEQKQVSLVGESTNMMLTLGKTITIKSAEGSFGSYRITAIKHSYKQGGMYLNYFTAVPLEIDVYPLTDIGLMHTSHPQIARVVDTNDPDGMSRIKVQFPWQAFGNQTTPWIRVATPYAGGNRGMHFIPEVNDEVLVGFENGDVERPYMQAALYTGVNKHSGWQSDKNNYKGFTTKGGHIVELNDTKGAEMITITDKNGNAIKIDTANNNIEVSALEDMTFNAKNIRISASEHIEVSAGKDMTNSVGENLNMMAKNKNVVVEKNLSVSTEKQEMVSEEITLSSNSENLTLISGKMVDVQSSEKVKLY